MSLEEYDIMSKEIDLDKTNDEYPCDMRLGYGRGCKCENNGVDVRLIRCNLNQSNVTLNQCKQCRYQQKYENKIKSEITE